MKFLFGSYSRKCIFVVGGYAIARNIFQNVSLERSVQSNQSIDSAKIEATSGKAWLLHESFQWKHILPMTYCEKQEQFLNLRRLHNDGNPVNNFMLWDFDYWLLMVINEAARDARRLQIEIFEKTELYDRIFEINSLKAPPNFLPLISKPDKFLKIFGVESLEKRFKPIYSNVTHVFQSISLVQRPAVLSFGTVTMETELTQDVIDEEIEDFNKIFIEVRGLLCREMVEYALKDNPNKSKLIPEYHKIAKSLSIY